MFYDNKRKRNVQEKIYLLVYASYCQVNKIAYATLIGNHVKVINVSLQYGSVLQYAASHGNENV